MKQFNCRLLLLFLITPIASAANFYCANTNKNINTGDSVAMVRQACGEPSFITTRKENISTPLQLTQWTYALVTATGNNSAAFIPILVLRFKDDLVFEIENGSIPLLGAVNPCNANNVIQIGDNSTIIRQRCGSPAFITKLEKTIVTTKEITQWIYNFGTYRPQILLDFDGDKLIEIKSGQLGN